MSLRNLSFHVGDVSAPPGDPDRLVDRFPTVQRAAFAVANHYMAHLNRVTLDGEAKLILQADLETQRLDAARIEWMDRVRLIHVPFPLADAEQLSGRPLKQLILDTIHETLLWYAGLKGMAADAFRAARESVLDADLRYAHYYRRGRVWKAPTGSRKFKLFVVFEWDRTEVYAEVLNGRTVEGHMLLHGTVPVECPYPSLVRDAKWSGQSTICLSTIDFATAQPVSVRRGVRHLLPGRAPA